MTHWRYRLVTWCALLALAAGAGVLGGCASAEAPSGDGANNGGASTNSGTTGTNNGGTSTDNSSTSTNNGTTSANNGGTSTNNATTTDPDAGDNNGTNNGTTTPDTGLDADEPDVDMDVAPDAVDPDGGDPDGGDLDADEPDADEPDAPPANMPPEAVVAQPIVGLAGDQLTFDGSDSVDPDGSIVAYDWTFGDGGSGNGPVTAYTYAAAGIFDATLTVTDDDGDTDTATFQVTVSDPNDVNPTAVITLPDAIAEVDQPVRVRGDSSIDPDGTVLGWSWTLEHDTSAWTETFDSPSFDVAFPEVGTYTITLVVTDNDNRTGEATASYRVGQGPEASFAFPQGPFGTNTPITFDASASSDLDGSIVTYDWTFGDGATGNGVSATHSYSQTGSFTVALTVTDDDGFTDTIEQAVTIDNPNQQPIANAGLDVTANPGDLVRFDGTGSSDPDGSIVNYTWDFGDGSFGSGATPSHTFNVGGTYTVTLTVTDNRGATATDTLTATIATPNQPPIANAGADRTIQLGTNVRLTAEGSSDPDGTLVAYAWDWGNGTMNGGFAVSHTYDNAGVYTVTLTVTDNEGATDTDTVQITVSAGNQPPTAQFTVQPSGNITADTPIQLNASGSSDPEGGNLSYRWDLGDNNTRMGLTASHLYTQTGTYTITLTVTDDGGLTDTATATVTVGCDATCYNGTYRHRFNDSELPVGGTCPGLEATAAFTIDPNTCSITINGSDMIVDCDDGVLYSGTYFNSDGSFLIEAEYSALYLDDPLCGINPSIIERIDGQFISTDEWEGEALITFQYENDLFCGSCDFVSDKNGRRL